MTTEKIMEIIYSYYPRGLSLDNGDDYDQSVEYQRRLQKCMEARKNSQNWVNFKKELSDSFTDSFIDNVCDYSILGTEPCYCLSVDLGTSHEPVIFSVLISIIAPLWVYRIQGSESLYYNFSNDEERTVVEFAESLVKKHFIGYELIFEDQHQIVINDIETMFNDQPTIFEALFKFDLN